MDILYTETINVYNNASFLKIGIWIVAIIVLATLAIYFDQKCATSHIVFMCVSLAFAAFFFGLFYFCWPSPGPLKYGVAVSEDYSIEEIKENYDILEVKGRLFVISEKEDATK